MKIQALHEFHDADYSKKWAQKFSPTSPRIKLFEIILAQIDKLASETKYVLELGIGPGFLASYLLKRLPQITYEGLDFSESMLEIAADRTKEYKERIDFTKADLINTDWSKSIKRTPDIIVSTWALHDLFEKKNIFSVYKRSFAILPKGRLLVNGDFIKPEESTHEYEGGRIKPSEHLDLLIKVGFSSADCLEEFEKSVENPTTSNNYACFKAIK